MFKRLETNQKKRVTIYINDRPYGVPADETVAAAVLASGIHHTRTTPVSGANRAPYCMMGVCYECLMVIDGKPNQRACQRTVADGMSIDCQQAAGPSGIKEVAK
ncbi:MAG: (2Fe-2S)-binding protein [Gammaproteobacteria bacterium]|nr:(2Fe-2S)-binding protein [Gammaproteobacteria bacterium]